MDNATLAPPNFVPPLRAQCFELLCATAILRGRQVGREYVERFPAIAEMLGLTYQQAFALAARGYAHRGSGCVEEAAHHYREATQLFAVHGALGSEARALTLAARCVRRGQPGPGGEDAPGRTPSPTRRTRPDSGPPARQRPPPDGLDFS
ncbi:hypothetical protein [Streptomyces albidoflavus]|uniref:hypothetical protein n=1 Tax=Streptomyces albidoflavus TaxID=1886 RepID=UPI0033D56334